MVVVVLLLLLLLLLLVVVVVTVLLVAVTLLPALASALDACGAGRTSTTGQRTWPSARRANCQGAWWKMAQRPRPTEALKGRKERPTSPEWQSCPNSLLQWLDHDVVNKLQ